MIAEANITFISRHWLTMFGQESGVEWRVISRRGESAALELFINTGDYNETLIGGGYCEYLPGSRERNFYPYDECEWLDKLTTFVRTLVKVKYPSKEELHRGLLLPSCFWRLRNFHRGSDFERRPRCRARCLCTS